MLRETNLRSVYALQLRVCALLNLTHFQSQPTACRNFYCFYQIRSQHLPFCDRNKVPITYAQTDRQSVIYSEFGANQEYIYIIGSMKLRFGCWLGAGHEMLTRDSFQEFSTGVAFFLLMSSLHQSINLLIKSKLTKKAISAQSDRETIHSTHSRFCRIIWSLRIFPSPSM